MKIKILILLFVFFFTPLQAKHFINLIITKSEKLSKNEPLIIFLEGWRQDINFENRNEIIIPLCLHNRRKSSSFSVYSERYKSWDNLTFKNSCHKAVQFCIDLNKFNQITLTRKYLEKR